MRTHAHGDVVELRAAGTPGRPSLLLVHGLEGSWTGWGPLVDQLQEDYHLLLADLPWRAGGSYRWRARSTPAQWLALAADLVGEAPAAVVAHSFGANAVLQWLAQRPSRGTPQAAVLLSPFYRPDSVGDNWRTFDRSHAEFEAVMAEGMRVRLGPRADLLEHDVVEGMATALLERIGPRGFLALYEQFMSSSELPLGDVTVPTLLVAGEDDPGIRGERAVQLHQAVGSARLHRSPHLTHFCHLAQPREVGDLVAGYLTEVLTPNGATSSAQPPRESP